MCIIGHLFLVDKTVVTIHRIMACGVGKHLQLICYKFALEKHTRDRMAQHPVQLNLKYVQCHKSTASLGDDTTG